MSLHSSKSRERAILALAVAMAVPIFALDVWTRHGIATWLLYLVPLLLASKVTGPKAISLLAGAFTALIWLGHFLSVPLHSSTSELINCSLAVVVLWVTTLFLTQRIRTDRRAEAERERLLADLAVEKARWEATVESMLDPVTVCDAEGRVSYMNAAHCHLDDRHVRKDLSFEAHPGHYQLYRPDGSLFAPQDLPLQCAALFGKEMRDVEVVHRTSAGRERVIIWDAAPVRNADGILTGAVAVGRDITVLREAQRALLQSEEAYRTLAENAPDIIERFNRQGAYTFVNRVGIRLRGIPADAILGRTISEIGVPEPYASRWQERIQRVFDTGESTEAEDGLFTRDGIRTFHSRFAPERAADGSVASVLVFSHDITERKRVEETLRASEERLRLAQQAAGTGTWEWDISTGGVTWSEEYYRIAGLSRAQTPASFARWLESVHPDDRERVMQISTRAMEEHVDVDVEFRLIRPDGSVRWLNEKGRTFYAEDGRPVRMLGISMDITERRLAEEALRSAREALEKQLEERTAALTGVGRRLQVEATRSEDAGDAITDLSELLNRRVGELTALDKVTWALASSLDPALVLRLLVSEVRGLLNTEGASVLLYEPERDELAFVAAEGLGAERLVGERVPVQASLAGWVLHERRAALVDDVRGHPLVADPLKVLADGAVRSILAVPLVSKGTGIGVLGTVNKIGGAFTDSDMESLAAIAGAAAVAIENARLYKMEQTRRTQLEAVRTVATEITRELDLSGLLHLIARRAGELLGGATGTVWLWDKEAQMLVPGVALGQEWWAGERRLRLGEGVAGTVAQQRKRLLVNDYRRSPFAHPMVRARSGISAALAEPLLYHDRLVGVIALDNERTGRAFRSEDQELLGLFAAHAAIAIGNAELYRELSLHRDRLRALTAQTLRSREEEAKRIARELHDEVGQSLTCILLAMQGIEGLESLEEVRRKVAEVRALAAKPLGDVQRLVRALRPVILDDLGLVAALDRYVKGFAAATGLHSEFYAHGLEGVRLLSALETSLYRMIQEALTNAAKHAKAQNVSVFLNRRGTRLSLIVEDDGQGFDVSAAKGREGGGVGLLGMEERAFLLGGTVTIESAPGAGTTIVVEMPLEAPEGTDGQN